VAVDALPWIGWLFFSIYLVLNLVHAWWKILTQALGGFGSVRSNVEALCDSLFCENGVGSRFFGSSPEIGYELVVSGLGGVGVWFFIEEGVFPQRRHMVA
ncbi:unnamed protein product, partial [Brassica rapa subsp. narinosa]